MQETNYKYSVIIPTYNRAAKLDKCLNSLVSQSYKNFEVIVCDDGSTDDTKEVVNKYQNSLNIYYLYGQNSGGPATPRNLGINNARGEWICFLDADDLWYSEKLATVDKFSNGCDFICHYVDILNSNYQKDGRIKTHDLSSNVFDKLMTRSNTIVTSSVCVKKDIVLQMGCFDVRKELVAVEDFDLWLKIARAGFRFHVIKNSLGGYWLGGDNISADGLKQAKRITSVFSKHRVFLRNKKLMRRSYGMEAYLNGRMQLSAGHSKEAVKLFRSSIGCAIWATRLKAVCYYLITFFRSTVSTAGSKSK